jgi:hypothetical protein
MTKEEQLQKLDDYINWIKIEVNYLKMREFSFKYLDEYIQFIETRKYLIEKFTGIEDYDTIINNHSKMILNKIESLMKKN